MGSNADLVKQGHGNVAIIMSRRMKFPSLQILCFGSCFFYQNLQKFGNLGKIGNLNSPVPRYLRHATTYGRVQERKEI